VTKKDVLLPNASTIIYAYTMMNAVIITILKHVIQVLKGVMRRDTDV